MSMWEIEGLTELAVRLVGQSTLSKPEQRSFFANLYALNDSPGKKNPLLS